MQEARAPTDIMIWPGNQNGHYSFILSLVVTDFIWTKDDINICNEGVEDVLHALWTCKSIQPVWDADCWGLASPLCNTPCTTWICWFHQQSFYSGCGSWTWGFCHNLLKSGFSNSLINVCLPFLKKTKRRSLTTL